MNTEPSAATLTDSVLRRLRRTAERSHPTIPFAASCSVQRLELRDLLDAYDAARHAQQQAEALMAVGAKISASASRMGNVLLSGYLAVPEQHIEALAAVLRATERDASSAGKRT